MTQPGEIDGVMKQMTQSFNPVIETRIQETMRNPTVLKWLALPHRVVLGQFSRSSRRKTLQYNIKREHANVSRRGAPRNITLCQAHFQLPLLIIIAQSLKPLNLLSTKDTSKSI